MACDPAHPSWNPTEGVFSFDSDVPTRIPRGWERAPKSPYGGGHGGRKVWKRFEDTRKEHDEGMGKTGSGAALEDTTNTAHSVKRLRLKGPPEIGMEGKENEPVTYVATLLDQARGTLKRKQTRRKSRKSDGRKPPEEGADIDAAVEPLAPENIIQEDSSRASQSPVLEDVRELLRSEDRSDDSLNVKPLRSGDEATDATGIGSSRDDSLVHAGPGVPEPMVATQSILTSPKETISAQQEVLAHSTPAPTSSLVPKDSAHEGQEVSAVLTPIEDTSHRLLQDNDSLREQSHISPSGLEARIETPKQVTIHQQEELLPINAETPLRVSSSKQKRPRECLDALSPGGSPQIGVSLLRRESLRRRESSSNTKGSRKTRSPKKKDPLSRRDTLQEREILQKVISENNQDPQKENLEPMMLGATMNAASDSKSLSSPAKSTGTEEDTSLSLATSECHPADYAMGDADSHSKDFNDAKAESDLHKVMEASKIFGQSKTYQGGESPLKSSIDEPEAIDRTNKVIATAEPGKAIQIEDTAEAQMDMPTRKTRSGTRFSDDTSMLRDFLSRAKASKAAKTPVLLPLDAPKPQTSPRRSPRKALGSHKGDGNATIARDLEGIPSHPSTPTRGFRSDVPEPDDADELTATPVSCRRSTRTRPPALSKTPPGAPSFIPVRRADGADAVVLHKSQAQELAVITRANTRRNKGQSKPPLLALQELPADTAELAIAKRRAESNKGVGWAAQLASYQDSKEKVEESEESRPKVRRLRGLGAANGTPAPKKTTAVASTSNGTPAPKRRGKAMLGK